MFRSRFIVCFLWLRVPLQVWKVVESMKNCGFWVLYIFRSGKVWKLEMVYVQKIFMFSRLLSQVCFSKKKNKERKSLKRKWKCFINLLMLRMQPVDLVADFMPGNQSRPSKKDLDPPPVQVSRCQHASLILKTVIQSVQCPALRDSKHITFFINWCSACSKHISLKHKQLHKYKGEMWIAMSQWFTVYFLLWHIIRKKKSDIDQSNWY